MVRPYWCHLVRAFRYCYAMLSLINLLNMWVADGLNTPLNRSMFNISNITEFCATQCEVMVELFGACATYEII